MMSQGSHTVYLVRHGETPMHADNRYVGTTDAPLTERGQHQAEQLGQWAAGAGLAAIVCSPLTRARDTAAPAAQATGLEVTTDGRWIELDFGVADGLTAAEMREAFPQQRAAFESDPYRNPLPDGEQPSAALARAQAALEDVCAAASSGGRVLVVAHGTLIRILLCSLLDIDPGRYRTAFPVFGNATGAVIRRRANGRVGLVALNAELRSGGNVW